MDVDCAESQEEYGHRIWKFIRKSLVLSCGGEKQKTDPADSTGFSNCCRLLQRFVLYGSTRRINPSHRRTQIPREDTSSTGDETSVNSPSHTYQYYIIYMVKILLHFHFQHDFD